MASRSWCGIVAIPMISAHANGLAIGAASRANSQTAAAVARAAMMLMYIFLSNVVAFLRMGMAPKRLFHYSIPLSHIIASTAAAPVVMPGITAQLKHARTPRLYQGL